MSAVDDSPQVEHQWANSLPRELAGILQERDNSTVDRQIARVAESWLEQNESAPELWELINKFVDDLVELALDDACAQDPTPWVHIHADLGAMGRYARPFDSKSDAFRFEYHPRVTEQEGGAA